MANLNTPSYNILVAKEKQIRAIQELYEGVNAIDALVPSAASTSNKLTDKTYVDNADTALQNNINAVTDVIPTEATSSNQLADKTWVSTQISSLGGMAIEKVLTQSRPVENNTYYIFRTAVASAIILGLPAVTDATNEVQVVKLYFTLDTGGSISFSTGKDVYPVDGTTLEEGNTYEMTLTYNGSVWIKEVKKIITT